MPFDFLVSWLMVSTRLAILLSVVIYFYTACVVARFCLADLLWSTYD